MEKMFSYGTLREKHVQRAVFGHTIDGIADAIIGYRVVSRTIVDKKAIAISGNADHSTIFATGRDDDRVEGILFYLTTDELRQADNYEDDAYKRVRVLLRSGADAWAYLAA